MLYSARGFLNLTHTELLDLQQQRREAGLILADAVKREQVVIVGGFYIRRVRDEEKEQPFQMRVLHYDGLFKLQVRYQDLTGSYGDGEAAWQGSWDLDTSHAVDETLVV